MIRFRLRDKTHQTKDNGPNAQKTNCNGSHNLYHYTYQTLPNSNAILDLLTCLLYSKLIMRHVIQSHKPKHEPILLSTEKKNLFKCILDRFDFISRFLSQVKNLIVKYSVHHLKLNADKHRSFELPRQ